MRTCLLPKTTTRLVMLTLSKAMRKSLLLAGCCTLLTPLAPAQTLAHRNWAGSGLNTAPWWRNAVFYRIAPASFQDSNGDGNGDLAGIAQRMDYLQSLGIDAIILQTPFDPSGFDDLITAASHHRIRILVDLRPTPGENIVAAARQWLARGASGIELHVSSADAANSSSQDALNAIRPILHALPGERVLIAAANPNTPTALTKAADLTETPITPPTSLSAQLGQPLNAATAPLFVTDPDARSAELFSHDSTPAHTLALNQAAAIQMLASPNAAASLLYGQEIGLEKPLNGLMQWTPSNLTPPGDLHPEEELLPEPVARPKPSDPNVYGAFVPYVAPKHIKPIALNPFDPNTFPGFSTRAVQPEPTPDTTPHELQLADTTRNVAVENHDPHSLLSFYKRLIQLHHDSPAIRSGQLTPLHLNQPNTLAWILRAPNASRTNPPLVIVCNLSLQPLSVSLADDLAPFHIRHVAIRNLLTSAPGMTIETTDHFTLPPNTVYLGQVYQ